MQIETGESRVRTTVPGSEGYCKIKWDNSGQVLRNVASIQWMLANSYHILRTSCVVGTVLDSLPILFLFLMTTQPLQSRHNFNFIDKETDSERVSNQPWFMVTGMARAHTMFVESKTLPPKIVYFYLENVWWIQKKWWNKLYCLKYKVWKQ